MRVGGNLGGSGLGGAVFAGSLNLLVGVVRSSHGVMGLEVGETSGLGATVATVRFGVAIDELLLGELDELSVGNLVGTFEGGDSVEGPAGTAGGLVLDGVNSTSGSPVNGSVGLLIGVSKGLNILFVIILDLTLVVLELFFVQVRELVVSHMEGILDGFSSLHGLLGFPEVVESVFVLSKVGVRLSVEGGPLGEASDESVDGLVVLDVVNLDVGVLDGVSLGSDESGEGDSAEGFHL